MTFARCVAFAAALALAGCQDLREYAGTWTGEVSGDPELAHGFAPASNISVEISSANRDAIAFSVQLAPGAPAAPFQPIRRAAGDALGDVQFAGGPLRTFFGYVTPPGEAPYLAIISLFAEARVELRLIRGIDDAYGVFALHRARER
jgi:hypothetical protein